MPCSHLPPADLPDPLRLDDGHLSETVLLLARGIAADLAFDRLPILADALEDAGCDNFALLNHLRHEAEHRVECWALRRLLRTTLMLPGGVPIIFAYCPPGTFLMGSDHPMAFSGEGPPHRVTLSKGFYAGISPVTQEQWWAVMGTDPSNFKGDDLPVESVSWDDAQSFCLVARKMVGREIRLPSEAESEYAARGGTQALFFWGNTFNRTQANCFWVGKTNPVRQYAARIPHPWGLLDVVGNVWEWCSDWYEEGFYSRSPELDPECKGGGQTDRISRGGSWESDPLYIHVASRGHEEPGHRGHSTGFRVVFTAT